MTLGSCSDSYSESFVYWGSSKTKKLIVFNRSMHGILFIFFMFVGNVINGTRFVRSEVYFLVTLKYSPFGLPGILELEIFSSFSSFGTLRVYSRSANGWTLLSNIPNFFNGLNSEDCLIILRYTTNYFLTSLSLGCSSDFFFAKSIIFNSLTEK